MLVRSLLAIAASTAAVASASYSEGKNSIVHVFDADYAGVDGTIIVTYDTPNYSGAKISADLRFASVDLKALKALDSNCTGDRVTEYKWHIHTKWHEQGSRVSSSDKFEGCSKAITGDHYDPYKICGPASEHAGTPACAPKIKDYNCTPESYKANFAACEAGDLSGKFGTFRPTSQGVYVNSWYDLRFPFFSEVTPSWTIVIHAVCGASTPRVACSNGHKSVSEAQTKTIVAQAHKSHKAEDQVHVKVHVHTTKKHN